MKDDAADTTMSSLREWDEPIPRLRMRGEKESILRPAPAVVLAEPVRLKEPAAPSALPRCAVFCGVVGLVSLLAYVMFDRFVMTSMVIPAQARSAVGPVAVAQSHHVSRWCCWLTKPQHGDRIVLRHESGLTIARVVAKPGDVLEIRGEAVLISGQRLEGFTVASLNKEFSAVNRGLLQLKPHQFCVSEEQPVEAGNHPRYLMVLQHDFLGRVTD